MTFSNLASQPQLVRVLRRSILGVGAAGISAAILATVGGGVLDNAAAAAVTAGGGYGAGGTEPVVADLAASPVEVADLTPTAAIQASPLQGAVGSVTVTPPAALAPPTTAPPAPTTTTSVLRRPAAAPAPGSVEAVIAEVFGANGQAAIGVARCESHLNPAAISKGGGNWGLFQINTAHRSRVARMGYQWEDLLDARVNALVAKSIFDEQGWRPWACRHAAR
jgi:hypothetical protein